MTALTVWYDEVIPECPGVSLVMALKAIRDVAIEFCTISHAYQKDLAAINSVAGTASYALISPVSGTELVRVLRVKYDGNDIRPIARSQIREKFGNGWEAEQGTPSRWWSEHATDIMLILKPSSAIVGAITVAAALRPAPTASAIADEIYQNYREAIAQGAKSRLMKMPGKKWSNPDVAVHYEARFRYKAGVAHITSYRGRAVGAVRSRTFYGHKES